MFNLNDTMRYFLCPGRTDMRKGISSLCGVVHEKMNSEVKNGDVFIFIGSSRRLMKLLHAEDGGMVMYVKRLEAGHSKLPEYDSKSNSYPMEWRDSDDGRGHSGESAAEAPAPKGRAQGISCIICFRSKQKFSDAVCVHR